MKKTRFSVCFLISFVLLISACFPFSASAAELAHGDLGEVAVWAVFEDGLLAVTGEGILPDVIPSEIPWQEHAAAITSLSLSEGITAIGVHDFLNLPSLASVTVPDTVTFIGQYALGYVYEDELYTPVPSFTITGKLGSAAETYAAENHFTFVPTEVPHPTGTFGDLSWDLTYDGTLTVTGSGPMPDLAKSTDAPWADLLGGQNGLRLLSVVISPGVTAVGAHNFEDSRRLAAVSLPEGLTDIGAAAFKGCSELSAVTIPGTVTRVGNEAFSACTSLSSLTVEPGVAAIGQEAFLLTGLTSLSLPASVTQIESKAFYTCSSLAEAALPGVTAIDSRAFADCAGLKTVSVGASLARIADSAFEGCESLTDFSFPSSLVAIGNRAFYENRSLTSVALPDSLRSLGDSAFYGCSGLTSLTIGNGLAALPTGAFENAALLSNVDLGSSVTSIGERAFSGTSSLTSITIPRQVKTIAPYAIGYLWVENEFGAGRYQKTDAFTVRSYIPSAAQSYAEEAGLSFESLGLIPSDSGQVTDTVAWSLQTASGALKITGTGLMPDYLSFNETPWSIYRDYIRSVTVSSDVQNVGASSFEGCTALSEISLAGSVKTIGDRAFSGTAIPSLILNSGLVSIGDSAFEGCLSLSSVILPNTLNSIGQGAFCNTSALKTVFIPENVDFIGSFAVGYLAGHTLYSDFVIKGVRGSIAENYAGINGITFREDGYVTVTDGESGASVSLLGDSADRFTLTFARTDEPFSPELLLAGNEFATVYRLTLLYRDQPVTAPENGASIRLPIPGNLNPLSLSIYALDSESGEWTPLSVRSENGFFAFSYDKLGLFIYSNVDLNALRTVNIRYLSESGAELLPGLRYRASAGASYNFAAPDIEGYHTDTGFYSGYVGNEDLDLVFTFRADVPAVETDPASPETDAESSEAQPKPSSRRTLLIVVEIALIIGLITAVVLLVLLNIKKRREEEEKAVIAAQAPKKNKADQFGDTIVVPEEPLKDLNIESLFADEPEEDIDQILKELQKKSRQNKEE